MPRCSKPGRKNIADPRSKSMYADGALGSACKKTKLCSFFQQGYCARDRNCNFAHGEAELKIAPDLSKTKMCPAMNRFGACNKGAACSHAHSIEELRPVTQALPESIVADALVAEWQRREELVPECGRPRSLSDASTDDWDGTLSEASGFLTRSISQSSERQEEEVFVVKDSFLDASSADRLKDGARLFYAPASIPLSIRNTFFDVDESPRATASRRSQSAGPRFV